MPDRNILTLRQTDQARTDFALIEDHLDFIAVQLARRPTRGDLALTALGIIFCTAVVHDVVRLDRVAVTRAAIIVAVIVALSAPVKAREYRSREVTREFQRDHPCPSTGKFSGACPGFRKDHVVPLACGGPDAVSNLQWQTVADARAKDHWERKACVH
jgi:hypothetical protein